MKTFQQFRDEISVIDMAISVGFRYDKKKGKKWPIYVNQHKEKIMIVNPRSSSNQGYRNVHDDDDKGTLIDFIRNRLGKDFPMDSALTEAMNINKALYSFSREAMPENLIYQSSEKPSKPFTTDGLTSSLIDPGYLLFRGIKKEVLFSEEFSGRILNIQSGIFTNTAFPFYDKNEKITAIEKRNCQYKYFVEGSLLTHSVWHSNFPVILEKIIIAESAIDALSYYQLKRPIHALYVSIGGALSFGQIDLIKSLKTRANVSDDFKFISAIDNDKAGELYNLKLKDRLHPEKLIIDKPINKDYNKDLENLIRSNRKLNNIKINRTDNYR